MNDDEVRVPASRTHWKVVPDAGVFFEEVLEALGQAKFAAAIESGCAQGRDQGRHHRSAFITPRAIRVFMSVSSAYLESALPGEGGRNAGGVLVRGGAEWSLAREVRGGGSFARSDSAVFFCVGGVIPVRRNRKRFPDDFMFSLSTHEVTRLRSQIVTSKITEGRGGRRYQVHAFTEEGVAMLSSVLRSETAVRVNIEIMRAFVRLRRAAIVSSQVMALVEDLSKRVDLHDAVITDIVESIRQLVEGPGSARSRPIGFTAAIEVADIK
jgi:hypothetical protein